MKAGLLAPVRLNRCQALTVASLIEARLSVSSLAAASPLSSARGCAQKLRKGALRRRSESPGDADAITLTTLTRQEALAGLFFLAWFFHPSVPDGVLTDEQTIAAFDVAGALGEQFAKRRGPKTGPRARLDRRAIERRLAPTTEDDPEPVDESQERKLRKRLAEEDALIAAALAPLPTKLVALLAPDEFTEN